MNAHLSILVVRAAAIALLTPLILLAGLIATVALPVLFLGRRVGDRLARSHRVPLAPVVALETTHVDAAAPLLSRQAA